MSLYEHLAKAIPDAQTLVELEPEELGSQIIVAWNSANEHRETLTNLIGLLDQREAYPRPHRVAVSLAIAEAWSWLESQSLIVTDYSQSSGSGWRILSRKAHGLKTTNDFSAFLTARLLPRERLHEAIRDQVWRHFVRGEFDAAVFAVLKRLEIAVRDACGWGRDKHGVPMIAEAFNVETGPLTEMSEPKAEREARRNLFTGAYGGYRNPHAHHDVNLDDPMEALEIILLGNHLLRIVDARRAAIEASRES